MKDKCERKNEGKPKLSYCDLGREVIEGEARVWEFGSKKYARGNWLKGAPYTESADSLRRHLIAFLNGEDLDKETGLPHVDHIVCCAKILSNAFHTRTDLDDRAVNCIATNDADQEFKIGDMVRIVQLPLETLVGCERKIVGFIGSDLYLLEGISLPCHRKSLVLV